MPIASVTAYPLAVPQPKGSGRQGSVSTLVVEVATRDGRSGFGEALSPTTARAAAAVVEDVFAPRLVGENEANIATLAAKMRTAFPTPVGGVIAEAISAIDIALWDLAGQAAGLPIRDLLAGHGRNALPAYASFIAWVDDAGAEAQAEAAVALGFRALKVKLQGPVTAAIARSRRVRETVGDGIGLCADPNAAFTYRDALRLAEALADLDYLWLEEPVDPTDYAALARLRAKDLLPIAAGENEFTAKGAAGLLAAGAVDLLQPDIGRTCGISGFRDAIGAAALHAIPFAPHHSGGAIKAAASLHLAAALPGFEIMECSLHRTALHDRLTREPVSHPDLLDAQGRLPVPTGPGLGIEVDRSTLAELSIR
ncbi:mandelate racemase/muconate lactonizing enzyme family protein [Acuticoccus kandeliae]|uniref:mandelate racemase/muconate lactonizing enzyme family protein n=1 Tax=Acuticoccus kandeliae TaxID=2073160 RepID=UPI000D3EB02F|nr:mandelate racemase/muconate lactonizing enzyme family protein [Acuticoccus kandeliae]